MSYTSKYTIFFTNYKIKTVEYRYQTYSSNPVALKDMHIYMYLFCGRPPPKARDGGGRQFF